MHHAPRTPRRRLRAARRAIRRLLTISVLAVAAISLAPGSASAASMLDLYEIYTVKHINRYRAAHGLGPLRIDMRLTRTAHWMAYDMATNSRFSHTDSYGRGMSTRMRAFGYPSNTWRGENLAAGNSGSYATFRQWVNSYGHRRELLRPQYRAIGIVRYCRKGTVYGCYWTAEFGSRWISRVPYP